MSVTGWKHRKRIRKIILFSAAAGVPVLILAVFLGSLCADLSKELEKYETEEKGMITRTGFVLKNEKKTGEEIQKSDLEEVELRGEAGSGIREDSLNEFTGKYCKTDLEAGTILTEELLAEPETFSRDLRKQAFSQIVFSNLVDRGDKVDIRISFPTGEDYVVLGKKEVLEITGTDEESVENSSLTFCLGEEEILRLSSALIDMELYPGTVVYALPYVDGFQEQAYITYPINRQVLTLMGWDPNVEFSSRTGDDFYGREEELRKELEKNLRGFFDEEDGKTDLQAAIETGYEEKTEFFP